MDNSFCTPLSVFPYLLTPYTIPLWTIRFEGPKIQIPYESLASFNEADSRWQVEAGDYTVMVATDAADARPLTSVVTLEGKVTETVRPSLMKEQK